MQDLLSKDFFIFAGLLIVAIQLVS